MQFSMALHAIVELNIMPHFAIVDYPWLVATVRAVFHAIVLLKLS